LQQQQKKKKKIEQSARLGKLHELVQKCVTPFIQDSAEIPENVYIIFKNWEKIAILFCVQTLQAAAAAAAAW
jgi:hypothetical protein